MTEVDLLDAAKAFFSHGFDGFIRIELIGEADVVWVDGRTHPPVVTVASPEDVDKRICVWRLDRLDIPLVLSPDHRRFESGFISGRIKISGDLAVMTRLQLDNG